MGLVLSDALCWAGALFGGYRTVGERDGEPKRKFEDAGVVEPCRREGETRVGSAAGGWGRARREVGAATRGDQEMLLSIEPRTASWGAGPGWNWSRS